MTSWRRRLLARVLVLVLALLVPYRVGPLVVVGPSHTVETRHHRLCVHTRLTDEVEPWKIKRTLQMVREMGVPWIVEYFPWAYMEIRPGVYDWTHADLVIDHAEAQGLQVIARIGMVPAWARPEISNGEVSPIDSDLDPDHYVDFADFVGEFVAHYRGRVNYVIIWNEPNLSLEWGYRAVDPEGYVELTRRAYTAAKAAHPEIQVLAGAVAPTLEGEGSPNGMNDLAYLDRLYAAGFSEVYDILAVHSYGLGSPPAAVPLATSINFRRLELMREIMVAHGDSHKQVMITESGWNDSPRWIFAVGKSARIDYTIGSYEWAEAHWPWARAVCTWAFRYPAPAYNYSDYYTFLTPDFRPQPIYTAVQAWAKGWGEQVRTGQAPMSEIKGVTG